MLSELYRGGMGTDKTEKSCIQKTHNQRSEFPILRVHVSLDMGRMFMWVQGG